MSDMSPMGYLICGGYGGILYVLASHPMDTLKVRMQTLTGKSENMSVRCNNMTDCFKKTIAHEGILGLWKGMGSSLLMVVPNYAMYFAGFGIGMYLFGSHDPAVQNTYGGYLFSGCFSSLVSTTVVAPGERIKCLMQIQTDEATRKYKGPFDCARKLYREGGVQNVFKGSVSTLVRDMPANGMFFLVYESLMDYMTGYGSTPPSNMQSVICGGAAGFIYWLLAIPVDGCKTLYQTAPPGKYKHGTMGIFKTIIKNEGFRGLYKGSMPILMSAVPANAACLLGFEQCRVFISPWFVHKATH